jgi:5-methylcytosine-specific restriction endonuclease McrA
MSVKCGYRRKYKYGKIWEQVFERDKNRCVLCDTKEDLCLNFIISITKGGKPEINNLRVLCRSCNTLETQKKRDLLPKNEKDRAYMRIWRLKNPGYMTKKSREFRKEHSGYCTENSNKYIQFYRLAKS